MFASGTTRLTNILPLLLLLFITIILTHPHRAEAFPFGFVPSNPLLRDDYYQFDSEKLRAEREREQVQSELLMVMTTVVPPDHSVTTPPWFEGKPPAGYATWHHFCQIHWQTWRCPGYKTIPHQAANAHSREVSRQPVQERTVYQRLLGFFGM